MAMRLSNNQSQNLSLQLSTSLALEQGVEQMHELIKDHQNNLTHTRFIREAKKHLLKANKKGFFVKNLPDSHFLKNDKNLLERIILYAAHRHQGEYRDSGHPYLAHVLSTGFILARLGFPKEVVMAGILHDTIEDALDKNKVLNELYALLPAIAYYTNSLSGPDIRDAVEKDKAMYSRIDSFSLHTNRLFSKAIKCADGIANLYDVELMQAKDGRTADQRQRRFINNIVSNIIPYAMEIDSQKIILIKKRKEVFSLKDYITEMVEEKSTWD